MEPYQWWWDGRGFMWIFPLTPAFDSLAPGYRALSRLLAIAPSSAGLRRPLAGDTHRTGVEYLSSIVPT